MNWFIKICGTKEYLLNQGVFHEFIDYALNSRFPKKMQKWLAFQLQKKWKSEGGQNKRDTQLLNTYLTQHEESLIEVRDWFNWMSQNENNFDINRYNLTSVILSLPDFHIMRAKHRPKGHPRYYKHPENEAEYLGNGFKIVEVPEEDLVNEGALMQHCVGDKEQGYTNEVSNGHTRIFSLRDEKNNPHATIETVFEFNPDLNHKWRITQIQGKQNQPPIDVYKPYIKKWINNNNDKLVMNNHIKWSVSTKEELIEEIIQNRGLNNTSIILNYLSEKIVKDELLDILIEEILIKNPNLEWSTRLSDIVFARIDLYNTHYLKIMTNFASAPKTDRVRQSLQYFLIKRIANIFTHIDAGNINVAAEYFQLIAEILSKLDHQLVNDKTNQELIQYINNMLTTNPPNIDDHEFNSMYNTLEKTQTKYKN